MGAQAKQEQAETPEQMRDKVQAVFGDVRSLSGKQVTILIPATEQHKGGVPGSINGVAFNIPRQIATRVPVEVLDVLQLCNEPNLAKDGVTIQGHTNRFNVQVLSAAE